MEQVVEINSNCSTLKPITKGVPQRSILGPLLFIAFINDLIRIYPDAMYVLYAADVSILISAANSEILQQKMNQILAQLNIWSCSNNLGINTSKTKAVLFRPKNKPANDNLHLVYHDTEIGLVNHIKILGVTFSSNMLWNERINGVLEQLSRVVGMVHRCKTVLPYNVKLFLYKSLFLFTPYLLFLGMGHYNLHKLAKVIIDEEEIHKNTFQFAV